MPSIQDFTVDPNNFTRLTVALERWVKTGELLVSCLERAEATANFARVRAMYESVQKIKDTISQLKG